MYTIIEKRLNTIKAGISSLQPIPTPIPSPEPSPYQSP